ncbi:MULTISPECIES: serine protease [unclassified Streptomyces]|uniref:trypsin-like serine peptidase n=1 Tax=unclassified Streptomyces TaxID=2593676 RepID=UPI002256D794|nr:MULTISPECIES: hypothetical protein [unclassified Streptomyces]MCX5334507.1 hypothetical protein [Streptomyces sp. NBC_00140]MCX5364016.1 hypothetical protein [Streptomyces sp. NBC_00124]
MNLTRIRTTAACTVALLAGLVTPAAAATPTAPAATVSMSEESKSPKEIRSYWTQDRIEKALANPVEQPALANDNGVSAEAPAVSASADAVQPSASTLAASTTAAAAADIAVAQDVPASTSVPNVVVGKLTFTKPDGTPASCSASVIVSDTANTIWTAGHCVHQGDGTGDAGWNTNLIFMPGYKDGQMPWGFWEAERKYAPTEWLEDGDTTDSDMAAVVLAPHADYGNLQDNIGGLGYQFGSVTDYSDVFAVGYPGEGYQRTDMDAEQMMYCFGNTEDAAPLWPLDDRLKMDCDMGAGSSGGPMFIGALGGNPQIVGAISHHEVDATTNERTNDDLFSAAHSSNAVAVIDEVNASA